MGIHFPIIVNQTSVAPSDLANASATTLFFQTIGGAFWVCAGQAAFVNTVVISAFPKWVSLKEGQLLGGFA
jgi:MFS transporter, DHA2 family, glioxin efflux transporter